MPINLVLQGRSVERCIIRPTVKDIRLVENLRVRRGKNKKSDLQKIVISKPWGAEYLCGRNKYLEVWELYINPASSTSLHCHPEKDTLNLVLEGSVDLETFGKREILVAGDFRLIKAGAIHRTINNSIGLTARVLEIESPPNKYDLIRVQDTYGRESLGYVPLRLRKAIKGKIVINYCFIADGHVSNSIYFREFIERRGYDNDGQSVRVEEVFLNSVTFNADKSEFLKNLVSYSAKSLMVTAGSMVLMKGKKCVKLLPGDCVVDIILHEYNWSSVKANILIW